MEASLLDVVHSKRLEEVVTWPGCLLAILGDVARGMTYLHWNEMLHRDLKPANVLIAESWTAKVADFGAAYVARTHARAGAVHGTPPYMAPEMIRRESYGRAVDVWSFGCVVAHVGARLPPFAELGAQASAEQIMDAVVEGVRTPVDLLSRVQCPPPLLQDRKSVV